MPLWPLYRTAPRLLSLGLAVALLAIGGSAWLSGWTPAVLRAATLALAALPVLVGSALLLHGLRLRVLGRDVATSRIASAPQGYVELLGKARPLPSQPTWTDQAWLWRRVVHARRSDTLFFRAFPFGMYRPVAWELTDRPFLLDDGSGEAIVLPQGAQVVCADRHSFRVEQAHMMEETIKPGDELYVLGHFSTHDAMPDLAEEAQHIAGAWAADPLERARFDLDRDGYLSVPELLRLRAKALAAAAAAQPRVRGAIHTVSKPLDGSRFVISTVPPAALSRHNAVYLILGTTLLAAGAAGVVFLIALLPS